MQIRLTQPVEGKAAGETVDIDADRAQWLVANGYATLPSGNVDHTNGSSVAAEKDPTLASNREGADEPTPHTDDPTIVQRDNLGSTQDANITPPHPAFDPKDYDVPTVVARMEEYPQDAPRILALERDGKKRKGILEADGSWLEVNPPQGATKIKVPEVPAS